MTIKIIREFENEFELREHLRSLDRLDEIADKYEDLYQWARSLWKHSDKETITVDELQKQFMGE